MVLTVAMLQARQRGKFTRQGERTHTYQPMYAPPIETMHFAIKREHYGGV
jgi:hypothetical protein